MKSIEEVKRKLEEVYSRRLEIRMNREMRVSCRNCIHGIRREYDLGEFGINSRWICCEAKEFSDTCGFCCKNTAESVENELLNDIRDPAVCGAKEPKIGVLMWFLHDSVCEIPELDANGSNELPENCSSEESVEKVSSEEKPCADSFWEKLFFWRK